MVCERFNALILRHEHLIRMARKLAETISFVLLVQLFISSMLICILGEYGVSPISRSRINEKKRHATKK